MLRAKVRETGFELIEKNEIKYEIEVIDMLQCQLVKNFENRINSLNIGIKYHSEMNPGANGVDHAICRTVLLFDCMVKKQVCKMPAM